MLATFFWFAKSITIEEEEIKIKKEKPKRKKNKNKKSNRIGRIQGLGKIVSEQVTWRKVAVVSKICLEYDRLEFTNFAFQEIFNGVSLKISPG